MMKKIICLILLAALTLGAAAAGEEAELTEKQLLSYYDDCLFVGDSITFQLRTYVREKQATDPEYMEKVKFNTAQSYMLYIASRKNLKAEATNLKHNGKEMPLWRIVGEMKPKRLLILLGVNDYVGEKIEQGVGWCERIVDLVAESSPDTEIIFQSLTPVTQKFCRKKDYRTMWDEYNAALKEMCEKRGVVYLDIATALKDEDGYLVNDYARDGLYHLNPRGLQVWLDALADYAKAQYDAGLWTPEEKAE